MPPFDAAPAGRPFLGAGGPADDRPDLSRHSGVVRRPDGLVTALFLIAVALIGGAGASYPLLEMAVELLSLGLLAHVLFRVDARPRIGRIEWALLLLIPAVPLAQLIPLSADVWTALPGRALPRAVLEATGLTPAAMPASVAPAATLRASLALLPGLAFFLAVRAESAAGRRTVARAIIALAVLSAVLGAVQLAAGAGGPAFQSAHGGQAIGLFVNRNHQATLLLVAILLTPAALQRPGGRSTAPAALGIAALLGAGVIATTSRTALLLLPLCLLPTLWPIVRRSPRAASRVIAAVATLTAAAWWQGSLPRLLARFGMPELRPDIWRTSWAAAQGYFPVGAGVGAFRSVYPLAERRDALTPFVVNHAHNDFLELLLETGAVAVIGLALLAWWFVRRSLAARRASARGLAPVALGGIAVLLVWSSVDYPLRTLALTAVFGMLCGMADAASPRKVRPAGRRRYLFLVPLALIGVVAVRDGFARRWPPAADVRQTLVAEPLDQRALGTWALARQRAGDPAAARGWAVAARLGWRDAVTQTVLTARDGDRGDMAGAVAHADALLRQGRVDPALLGVMRLGVGDPRFANALAAVLAGDPVWRTRYMMRLDDLDAAATGRHLMLLRAMLAGHVAVRADEAAALVVRAGAVGRGDVAEQAWAMIVALGRLGDPTLALVDASWRARQAVGGWHRTALPGLDALADGSLQLDRGMAGTLLYQDLHLAPGRYLLTADVVADVPLDGGTLRWTATCAGDVRLDGDPVPSAAGGAHLQTRTPVTVPPGCQRQRLALDGTGNGVGPVRLRPRLSLTAY